MDNCNLSLSHSQLQTCQELSTSPVVQGAESGSTYAKLSGPVADNSINVQRENQLKEIKKTIASTSPTAACRQSSKGKSFHQGDPKESWQGMEHYLRQETHDADPEALRLNRKRFPQRKWCAYTIYATLLSLMVAAIVALVCTRLLGGEVSNNSEVSKAESISSHLQQEQLSEDSTTPSPTTNAATDRGLSLLEDHPDGVPTTERPVESLVPTTNAATDRGPLLLEDHPDAVLTERPVEPSTASTAEDESTTATGEPVPTNIVADPVVQRRRFRLNFMLSLPDPVPRFFPVL